MVRVRSQILFISLLFFFFFNDQATTEIYTLSLHDALPISLFWLLFSSSLSSSSSDQVPFASFSNPFFSLKLLFNLLSLDRKSTRLNSSHMSISYAVFCLKKKRNSCESAR